jgi:hypothetical protein
MPAAIALVALLAAPALAQGRRAAPTREQLQDRHAKLVAEDWFVDGGWTEDFEAAKARAREGDELIVAYFSRSYAT